MNYRQRMLAALQGQPVDFVPWAPRWELFFNAALRDGRMPEKYQGWSMFDVARDLGMGIKGYRSPLFRIELSNVEIDQRRDGLETVTKYLTPFGEVTSVYRDTPELMNEGVRGLEMEYLIKGRQDYEPVLHLLENTKVVATYDEFEEFDREVGNDGLPIAQAGPCPMHKFQREYSGYQQSYYEIMDNLPLVEKVTESLQAQFDEIAAICANSSAQLVECDGNFDISLHPPAFFRQWFLGPLQSFADTIHASGKLLATHADGQMEGLLELVPEARIDVAEAWSPYPQTSVTNAQARQVWGTRVAIWGGLPTPVLRASYPDDQFEEYFLDQLQQLAPGDRLVLGTGDNFPTDSSFDRVRQVTRLVSEHCKYPLKGTG